MTCLKFGYGRVVDSPATPLAGGSRTRCHTRVGPRVFGVEIVWVFISVVTAGLLL